jgi:chemotaxis protein methyltransferase CheR
MVEQIIGYSQEMSEQKMMSDADFVALSGLIHDQTGIVINSAKRSMLVSRLSRRLRSLGLKNFAEYRVLIEGPDGADERRRLVSVITTNVTSFFREPVHFEALSELVPKFASRTAIGDKIRLWSAGCSSGEEPYSIAMTLLKHWPEHTNADVRILATDIDPEMIASARRGAFTHQQIGTDPHELVLRFAMQDEGRTTFLINPIVQKVLRFEELNLLADWPFAGKFDVIFCRNVVIYFDSETRRRLWRRFAERLHAGGMLFIGHSERVDAELEPYLEPYGPTQYQRTNLPLAVHQ